MWETLTATLVALGPAALAQVFPLQDPVPDAEKVGIPIFPLFVAVGGILAIIVVSLGALRLPRLARKPRAPKPERPKAVVVAAATEEPAAPSPVAPVFKRAPINIVFPMIKAGLPDTWGVGEKAVIVFRAEDRGLVGKSEVKGLVATVGDEPVPLVFYRGEARLERSFPTPADVSIVAELRVKSEKSPRRTTRVLRIVDYREEIAELFEQFRDTMSQRVTPLRHDATAWEIYDALLDANRKLSQVALREVVSSFEEAKFSNHPVGRETFEKMVRAIRVLTPAEA